MTRYTWSGGWMTAGGRGAPAAGPHRRRFGHRRTPGATAIRLATALAWVACPGAATAGERPVWFGTYTGPRAGAEGIYVARFDDDRGTLTRPVLAAAARNPSFLALHPRLPMLYAVSEVADADGAARGAVEAFAVDGATGMLESRGAESTGGAGPCHVALDPGGRVVLAANYGGGSVACLGLDDAGRLAPLAGSGGRSGLVRHAWDRDGEDGIDRRRQREPHAHSIDAVPGRPLVVACDLGLDRVLAYRLIPETATLEPLPAWAATTRAGAGPRHLAIHPDGRRAWCIAELDLTVYALAIPPQRGPTVTGTFAAIPAGVADRAGFSGAEIAVHPGGRHVYASIRGHDSIAMFRIAGDSSADLEFLGSEPTRARTPRHFAIDPTGRFLLVAGQDSGTVVIFTIDPETGRLAWTGRSIDVPAPVCILFGRAW